jgi:hypothetical protein
VEVNREEKKGEWKKWISILIALFILLLLFVWLAEMLGDDEVPTDNTTPQEYLPFGQNNLPDRSYSRDDFNFVDKNIGVYIEAENLTATNTVRLASRIIRGIPASGNRVQFQISSAEFISDFSSGEEIVVENSNGDVLEIQSFGMFSQEDMGGGGIPAIQTNFRPLEPRSDDASTTTDTGIPPVSLGGGDDDDDFALPLLPLPIPPGLVILSDTPLPPGTTPGPGVIIPGEGVSDGHGGILLGSGILVGASSLGSLFGGGGGSGSEAGASVSGGGLMPFGGPVLFSTQCTCQSAELLNIGPPSSGSYLYDYTSTIVYDNHNPGIGSNVLGQYSIGGICYVYVGEDCISVTADGTITQMGTS